ncbi:HET-domain-containing protein [Fusarium austroafricanum]|uniref:HET-domain-containing protein n=1 Tax=Fusarium austroafricanum TaxID=2364996 RepID=A0A8H4KDY7_9HYPO|nr:HET-domain-containing protein [Fusarium austroafricanum]
MSSKSQPPTPSKAPENDDDSEAGETYQHQVPDTFRNDGKIGGKRIKCFIQGILPADHNFEGPTAFGSLLVVTEPVLVTILQESQDLPDTTHVKLPRTVLLSEGCLEQRNSFGGVKRRRLWPDVNLDLVKAATKDELYRPGSLAPSRDDLPWTIRDFFIVVNGLGERYAWVDSLCIIQDD